jgi:acyl transferase domain-containing protein
MPIRYGAVSGHSVGEVAAAWAAGALTLEQAVLVIFVRSEAQGRTRGAGRMAAVGMGVSEVSTLLDQLGLGQAVDVAGINSPKSVTLSGSLADLERFGERVARDGAFFQLLDLDYAFHSRHMDGVRQRVVGGLAGLRPHALRIRFISAVSGESVDGDSLGAGYWWDNIRRPVRFGDAVGSLIASGTQLFLEVGPHSILRGYVSQSLQAAGVRGQVLPTLKRNHDSAINLRNALFAGFSQVRGASLSR